MRSTFGVGARRPLFSVAGPITPACGESQSQQQRESNRSGQLMRSKIRKMDLNRLCWEKVGILQTRSPHGDWSHVRPCSAGSELNACCPHVHVVDETLVLFTPQVWIPDRRRGRSNETLPVITQGRTEACLWHTRTCACTAHRRRCPLNINEHLTESKRSPRSNILVMFMLLRSYYITFSHLTCTSHQPAASRFCTWAWARKTTGLPQTVRKAP